MKRKPNGYGTIMKLSGNRQHPYAAYTPYTRHNGKKKREVIGYFEKYEQADQALAQWNRVRGTKTNYTLQQLYDEWSVKAYESISRSTADGYRAAWKKMSDLFDLKVRDIRTGHFQAVVDQGKEDGKSYSCLHDVKVLSGQLEKYAMQYDIIQKNYAEFIELPPNNVEEKEPFTDSQIIQLEKAAEDNFMSARLIVILIYTGWRISEFLALKPSDYDPENNTLTGGLKTENGKNRVVPVNPIIQPYVDELLAQGGPRIACRQQSTGRGKNKSVTLVPITPSYFREKHFKPTLDALGLKKSDGADFTPHATRHTFITQGKKNGVDGLVMKKLVGHSPTGDVTEKTYTHVDLEMLNKAVSLMKKADKTE